MHDSFIKREWLVAKTARNINRAAAFLSVGLAAIVLDAITGGRVVSVAALVNELRPVVFVCVMGAVTISMAMESYYFVLDDEPGVLRNIFWFVVMCLFPVGAPLYFHFVYSRSKYFRAETETNEARFTAGADS